MIKLRSLFALLALILTFSAFAQTADAPAAIGNASTFVWLPNAPDDFVEKYNVYAIIGSNAVRLAITTKPEISFSSVLFKNGTYTLAVSAVNSIGESALSTNIYVKYFANKPNPPEGLRSVQSIPGQFAPATVTH